MVVVVVVVMMVGDIIAHSMGYPKMIRGRGVQG